MFKDDINLFYLLLLRGTYRVVELRGIEIYKGSISFVNLCTTDRANNALDNFIFSSILTNLLQKSKIIHYMPLKSLPLIKNYLANY